ncbi:mas-related G-protein coupled receptor member H-like [Candoia aspera]|uniref:mas-related G-protein coupled receptor member H-like n=1 Tax=Candoia aspera TaxID=51853 RepID=UPI002FD84842
MNYPIQAGLPDIATLNAQAENYDYNNTDSEAIVVYSGYWTLEDTIYTLSIIISIFGVMGNGIVLWLLGFKIKRNPFTVYILNLAVADFGVLVVLDLQCICIFLPLITLENYVIILFNLFMFVYCTSQFLLTTISIDRCVATLFPIWHRCHRPPCLSTVLCAFIWVFAFLPFGIKIIFVVTRGVNISREALSFFINTLFCLPLMTLSSLILLVKVCLKPKQQKRRKLLTIILLSLFCFLILAFPLTLAELMNFFGYVTPSYCFTILFACINSSINPVIYFLVGSRKNSQSRQSLKVIFQKIFKEDEESRKG